SAMAEQSDHLADIRGLRWVLRLRCYQVHLWALKPGAHCVAGFSDEKHLVGTRGHLFLAVNPSCFGDPQACRVATSDYLEEVTKSRRAVGATEIRIPGAQRKMSRLRSVADGVCIYEVVWNKAVILAAELGVTPPSL